MHLFDEAARRDGSPQVTPSNGARQVDAVTTRRPRVYSRILDPDTEPGVVAVPEVRVTAAAGGGAVAEYEALGDSWYFPVDWLRHELRARARSAEHTSELQSLMRSSSAVFC